MPAKPFSLGRGLSSLIPQKRDSTPAPKEKEIFAVVAADAVSELGRIHNVPIGKIKPNSRQPRRYFDHAELESLIASIREHGIVQPLVARKLADGTFELIAGERRLRASMALGLTTVPVIIRETKDDREKLLLSLVENINRHDLNPLEEAEAYSQLAGEFNLTQEEIGRQVGKNRSTIANMMRLLALPEEMRQAIISGSLGASQAKVLAGITDEAARRKMFNDMLGGGVTVRVAEEAAREKKTIASLPNAQTAADAEALRRKLGTKVVITGAGKNGSIKISYFSEEEYRELVAKLGIRG
jgi:ParB family transcriptional regulator, chromosome partitioning protein